MSEISHVKLLTLEYVVEFLESWFQFSRRKPFLGTAFLVFIVECYKDSFAVMKCRERGGRRGESPSKW